ADGEPGAGAPRRAAPAHRRVLAQAEFETRQLLSHGEQLLVSVVLPLLALLGLVGTERPALGPGRHVDLAVAGVLALAVVSTAFTGQAILLAYERRYGVLRLAGTTPVGPVGLLLGKAASVVAVIAVQGVVLASAGLALGWEPVAAGLLPAVATLLLGAWAFAALGALLGGTLRAEGVLALANLLWVLLLAGGGLVLAVDLLPVPPAVAAGLGWLPSAALGDALRGALVAGEVRWPELALLAGWGSLGTVLAARFLRWSD
ncbi:ABC transporter permease, partial [Ornithinicoccus halotolerans]|uniref:ABC transporter permease n=1 Tax=Ornithinicoccus halotolerans TaxID=1748220 RepID=UPI003899275C